MAACEENDLAVIGVDAFQVEQARTVPLLHLVADFTSMSAADWDAFRGLCNSETSRFISGLPKQLDLMVTLTVVPQGAWASGD